MLIPRLLLSMALAQGCASVRAAEPKTTDAPAPAAAAAEAPAPSKLSASEWASEALLGSPIALSVDDSSRVYVTQTTRRKYADLDIRAHTSWIPTELSFRSVDQRREFVHRELSPENSAANAKWLKDVNKDGSSDWRDLTTLSELVLRLEDKAGKGVADTKLIFADGFQSEVTGVAAGVMTFGGDVYMTCIPDMWKLRDTDGDGIADQKKPLVSGFGVHFAYAGHDMHGLIMGPDGRVYWSIGDKGVDAKGLDGRRASRPHEGCVLRCETDGTGFEIFAHGLRNPHEIAFNEFGDLIGVDNDGDMPGERERFVYITEFSDSGWRSNWQYRKGEYNPWLAEGLFRATTPNQAAYLTPPLANYSDGPCGFVYNPGTALSPAYKGYFFLTQFPGRKMTAFRAEPSGAAYKMEGEHTAFTGPMMTGLAWAPDGSLMVADWNTAKWEPHNKGRIWKLDVPAAEANPDRESVKELLTRGFATVAIEELVTLLGHGDQRIRQRAQFELAERSQRDVLAQAAKGPQPLVARIHALWGLWQLARKDAAALVGIETLLSDPEAEIRAQTIKILGDCRVREVAPSVVPLLSDPSARVRFHAGIALAKIGKSADLPAILEMIEKNADADAFLRHAGVTAMSSVSAKSISKLTRLRGHASPAVRMAAVLALRRLRAGGAVDFLADPVPAIVTEAARAIHDDDSISKEIGDLAAVLNKRGLSNEPVIRRAINACLRSGSADDALRLAAYASNSTAPVEMRAEALRTLATWTAPAVLDRVEGRHRLLDPRPMADAHAALDEADGLFNAPDAVKAAAIRAVTALQYNKGEPHLLAIVRATAAPAPLRREALRGLYALKSESLEQALEAALQSTDKPLQAEARRISTAGKSGADPSGAAMELLRTIEGGVLKEQQAAFEDLGKLKSVEATTIIDDWLEKLTAGTAPEGLHLDIMDAARANGTPALLAKVGNIEEAAGGSPKYLLKGGDAALGEKLALEHIESQCIRCHKIGAEGAEVGPDLTKVATRLDRKGLLISMLEPNAAIAPGFGMSIITMKSGELVSGSVLKQTDTEVEVKTPEGKLVTLEKGNIASQSEPISMMPPMSAILKPREIRDLVEYLSKLK